MKITWRGDFCFEITDSLKKKEKVVIVIDPFSKEIYPKPQKMGADILLMNFSDKDNIDGITSQGISGNPFIASSPGEYEIKGVFIQGIHAFHDNVQGKKAGETTIFVINVLGIKLCHLGGLGQEELSDSQLEKIGNIDVLMVPVGGVNTIDGKEATKIVSQLEPKMVIPMHYKTAGLKIKLDPLDTFLKAMGQKETEPQDKLVITKRDLTEEKAELIVLSPISQN